MATLQTATTDGALLDQAIAGLRGRVLARDSVADDTTRAALVYLQTLFATPASPRVVMAIRGLTTHVARERVEAVYTAFASRVPIHALGLPHDAHGDPDE